jgi:hypothetical protein
MWSSLVNFVRKACCWIQTRTNLKWRGCANFTLGSDFNAFVEVNFFYTFLSLSIKAQTLKKLCIFYNNHAYVFR